MTEVRTPDVSARQLQELLKQRRELTDEQIIEMLANIRPVVRRRGELYYIAKVDPKRIAFTWSPTVLNRATGLTRLNEILTLHTFGYYGFFKPSLEEVLSMIPPKLIKETKAFETVGPETRDDLHRQNAATQAGYHVAITVLYG